MWNQSFGVEFFRSRDRQGADAQELKTLCLDRGRVCEPDWQWRGAAGRKG
jgi:hypothetical protein